MWWWGHLVKNPVLGISGFHGITSEGQALSVDYEHASMSTITSLVPRLLLCRRMELGRTLSTRQHKNIINTLYSDSMERARQVRPSHFSLNLFSSHWFYKLTDHTTALVHQSPVWCVTMVTWHSERDVYNNNYVYNKYPILLSKSLCVRLFTRWVLVPVTLSFSGSTRPGHS